MVLEKRLNDGFSGYLVPLTPRATRSAWRRSIIRSKAVNNQMCAFDLLATVAGNFLVEGNNYSSSADASNGKEKPTSLKDSVKKEEYSEDKPLDSRSCDHGICDQNSSDTELVSLAPVLNNCSKEHPLAQYDDCFGPASAVTTSVCSVKVDSPVELVGDESKARLGSFARIANAESSGFKVSSSCKLKVENKRQVKTEPFKNEKASIRNMADMYSSDCHVTWGRNPSELVSSHHSVKFPLSRDHIPCGSFSVNRDDVKLGTRDDDESSGCTQPSALNKAVRSLPWNEDRKIQKSVASDYGKVGSPIEDGEQFNADVETRHVCHNRKSGFNRERSLSDYPFKKRRLYDYCFVSNPDGGDNGEGICSSHGKGSCRDILVPDETPEGVTGQLSSAAVECASFQSKDSHVKLKIKSFRVPELSIEIPETATVASLKRTVKEAVADILGSGVRVGVLLQGKKIRDDSKTLLQTGICQGNKSDGLGFTLEPNSSKAPPILCSDRHPSLLTCDTPQPLTRYPASYSFVHNGVQHRSSDILPDPPATSVINFVESDHDSAPSPPDTSQEKSTVDSRALVAVASMNAETLNVVDMRKPKKSESAQRRIRRPFSVAEVEALVQAVEKLGTGRWRDVELQAFDTAKHRTYVDLKDKWKTLVHTARISPQQRRGETVPQELLDRVLVAHAYWAQRQAKQQLKQHSEVCRL